MYTQTYVYLFIFWCSVKGTKNTPPEETKEKLVFRSYFYLARHKEMLKLLLFQIVHFLSLK